MMETTFCDSRSVLKLPSREMTNVVCVCFLHAEIDREDRFFLVLTGMNILYLQGFLVPIWGWIRGFCIP